MNKFLLYIFFTGYSIFYLQAQEINTLYTTKDSILTESLLKQFTDKRSLSSVEKQVIQIGNLFIGTPYVSKTLEKKGKEQLVVNLREMDCTTFVETVTALIIVPTFKKFATEMVLLMNIPQDYTTLVIGYKTIYKKALLKK